MNTENRDFVIERLERQLKEKEAEMDDIRNNLRDSILREIRSDLKNDLDFNNRITQLEHKVQALSNNVNGIMDELLDQKSMLKALKDLSVQREKKTEAKPVQKPSQEPSAEPSADNTAQKTPKTETPSPRVYRPEPRSVVPTADASKPQPPSMSPSSVSTAKPPARKEPEPSSKPFNSKVSVRSDGSESPARTADPSSSSNVRFNVREVPQVKKPEMPEPEHRSEYIIAETDDERQMRLNRTSQQDMRSCNYIVAEEDAAPSCNGGEEDSEYETVEAREDEDAVVVTTRRK